jgi:hypothetical protein
VARPNTGTTEQHHARRRVLSGNYRFAAIRKHQHSPGVVPHALMHNTAGHHIRGALGVVGWHRDPGTGSKFGM